ncbi:hypothetical protein Pan44_47170 [Caulifigura coniformis]|uniref:Restriction endonuclease type IV Mrr domain-containing protein n=1 Tax=Caulifigura coniformis TaxID=2527983 RepID=A0A517SKM0_9PLAN|nr:restriction endonuclease [Caulifigura coniformis]QDT56660.1 hypothetical protein Pan44_47170 [Caulifigura coniformis]
MSEPDWRQFEIAVADFVKALGTGANVTHDVKLPDTHTGHMRQRDVWIETSLGGLFIVKLLVSCKHYGRVLNELDIDHFNGEFLSSGAHKGVLYSLAGFNPFAIEKAKKLGFCCCRLYEDTPADLPESLVFHSYCLPSRMRLSAVALSGDWNENVTWNDIFTVKLGDGDKTILDSLTDAFAKHEQKALDAIAWARGFPTPWAVRITFASAADPTQSLILELGESWRIFRGNVEAHLLNGSYNVTSDQFIGSQVSPSVDMKGPDPGPGWTLLDKSPEWEATDSILICIPRADPKRNLQDSYGCRRVLAREG